MSSKFFNNQGGSEVFSYIAAAFFYAAGAIASWFDGTYSFVMHGVLFKPLTTFILHPVTYVLAVLIFGLLFSWLTQQFCRRHKIMGNKTHAPVLLSAVFASLLPGTVGFEWWLFFGILFVLVLDAIFNASPQESEQIGSVLFSGTLLFVMSALSLTALWFIPIVLLALTLFVSFDLRRIVALFLAFGIPWFIVFGVMLMTGNTSLFHAHWQYPWLHMALPQTSKLDLWYLSFGLSILLGWLLVFFRYNSNASKQRKIHSVVLISAFYLLAGALFSSGVPLPRYPLLLVPAVLCSSYFYSRNDRLWLNKLIFWTQILSWVFIRFNVWIDPLVKDWQLMIFG